MSKCLQFQPKKIDFGDAQVHVVVIKTLLTMSTKLGMAGCSDLMEENWPAVQKPHKLGSPRRRHDLRLDHAKAVAQHVYALFRTDDVYLD